MEMAFFVSAAVLCVEAEASVLSVPLVSPAEVFSFQLFKVLLPGTDVSLLLESDPGDIRLSGTVTVVCLLLLKRL